MEANMTDEKYGHYYKDLMEKRSKKITAEAIEAARLAREAVKDSQHYIKSLKELEKSCKRTEIPEMISIVEKTYELVKKASTDASAQEVEFQKATTHAQRIQILSSIKGAKFQAELNRDRIRYQEEQIILLMDMQRQ